jgi:hypothetical protein
MDRIDHHYPTEPLPWRTNLSEYYDPIARVLHPGCGGPMMRFPPPHYWREDKWGSDSCLHPKETEF